MLGGSFIIAGIMRLILIFFLGLLYAAPTFGQIKAGTYSRTDENGKGEFTISVIKKGKKSFLKFDGYAGGAESGTCVGEVKGKANFVTPTVAEYKKIEKNSGENSYCELTFIFSKGLIIIKEINCSDYHGAACEFGGTYKRGKLK